LYSFVRDHWLETDMEPWDSMKICRTNNQNIFSCHSKWNALNCWEWWESWILNNGILTQAAHQLGIKRLQIIIIIRLFNMPF